MIKPIIVATVITCVSIPVWLLLLMLYQQSQGHEINAAGSLVYAFLIMILAVPFSLVISTIFALSLEKHSNKSVLSRFLLVAVIYILAFLWLYLFFNFMNRSASGMSSYWLILWYLLVFMLPPSLIGTLSLIFLWKDVEDTTV